MARSFKDEVMLTTIKEWASITGFSDDEILAWTVKQLKDKLKEAQGDAGPYWRVFLRTLKQNLVSETSKRLSEQGIVVSEVNLLAWPEALENPNGSAADAELDDVADQIRIEIR